MPARTFEITSGEPVEMRCAASLSEASALVPPGAYSTLRTHGGDGVVAFAHHLRRLEDSAAAQGQPGRLDAVAARTGLAAALAEAGHAESRVRLTWAPPHLFAAIEPFEPLPAALYEAGVSCVTVPVRRHDPRTKDTRFLETARAAYGALPPETHEGLLVGEDGALLEGLSSNFFAVAAGILHTEEERALAGITRTLVLEAARGVLPLATTALRLDQLREATEAFLTSASRGILPVVRVDDVRIGTGRPGPLTAELRRRFDEIIARETEPL
jgi:branched-chain amino acid aminotransferase